MAREYSWYEIVNKNDDLLQGDFIDKCPIVRPPQTIIPNGDVEVDIEEFDVIILSQSCDIINEKISLVLVSPVILLSDMETADTTWQSKKNKEALRRGNIPGYHLLNICELEGFKRGFQVVDFRNVFGVPREFIVNFAKTKETRLRLLPPYREQLSQSFARYFMRVGLPTDIPPFA